MPYIKPKPQLEPTTTAIKKYSILQEIEITEYPTGQRYMKVIWCKEKTTNQANQQTNQQRKIKANEKKKVMDIGKIEEAITREL